MNKEVKTILTNLVVDGATISVNHLRYKGNDKTFVIWTVTGEQPNMVANDIDMYSTVTVDIDVYSDKDYSNIIEEIKRRFINNDWLWYEDSGEMYDDETELYHRTITFKKGKVL